MKLRYLLIILLLPLKGFNQEQCDSTLYKELIHFSNSKTITDSDFKKCCVITENLLKAKCNDYLKEINGQSYCITTLTYTFGKICINANSINAVREYLKYFLEKKGSAEEQLSFSLENIFVKRPRDFMNEFARKDSATKERILEGLVWGFLNNRCYGTVDPHSDNPMKAMTVYDNPPKMVLDTLNYKKIYFSLNPEIGKIYPSFQKDIDKVLNNIFGAVRFEMKRKKNN